MPEPTEQPELDAAPVEQPARPRAGAPPMFALLVPLVASFAGPQGSLRRFVFGVLGTLILALNHRLGLALTIEEQGLLAGTIVTIIVGSNLKESSQAKSGAIVESGRAQVAAVQAQAHAQTQVAAANVKIAEVQAAATKPPAPAPATTPEA